MRRTTPNHLLMLSRWVSFLAALAIALYSTALMAEEKRVLVDIGPVDNDLSRAARARLAAELNAAGFALTTAENMADVRATLVSRDGRLVVYLELPNGATTVIRADDVDESQAPEVLAVRAVERVRADFVAAVSPTPLLAHPAPATSPKQAPERKRTPISLPISAVPRHVLLGAVVSLDGGAFSIAPTIAVGTGLNRHFFVRGSFFGPTTNTLVQSPAGQATVWSLGGRLDGGLAFSVRRGMTLGGAASLGFGRYAIEGRASPGFKPRSMAQPVFLGGLNAFWLQAVTGRLYLEVDLGLTLALPSVVIRINQRDAGERGFPALHTRIGLAFAF